MRHSFDSASKTRHSWGANVSFMTLKRQYLASRIGNFQQTRVHYCIGDRDQIACCARTCHTQEEPALQLLVLLSSASTHPRAARNRAGGHINCTLDGVAQCPVTALERT